MAKLKIRWILWRAARLLVLTFFGIFVVVALFQSRFIYLPSRRLEGTPKDVGLGYEDVTLETADGVGLHGWFVPAAEAGGAILLCHGNGGNISHRLESIEIFNRQGLDVLIFDYRGYGQSEGRPGEQGTYADSEAAWRYLTETKGIPPERIIVFGRSLGGSVAARLAGKHEPAGLIVESAFTSIADLAGDIYPLLPLRPLVRHKHQTIEYVGQVSCPVLVVHSPDDDLIGFAHGERIFEAAREPKQFLTITGGHNEGFFNSGSVYTDGLAAFLARCGLGPAGE